jgi:hypothetical protein
MPGGVRELPRRGRPDNISAIALLAILVHEREKGMGKEINAIHRYTDLPALLYLLQRKKLTLLDPMSWDDANDSHFLAVYKKLRNCAALLRFVSARRMKPTITGVSSPAARVAFGSPSRRIVYAAQLSLLSSQRSL